MIAFLYPALLLASSIYIAARGNFEQRLVLVTLMAGSIFTAVIYGISAHESWLGLNLGMVMNEAVVLSVILFVAYRSRRFWPLFIAAFEAAALLAQFAGTFARNPVSYALGMTQGIWAYFQLIVLMLATWRNRRASSTSESS